MIINCEIYFFTENEGGQKGSLKSGIKPQIVLHKGKSTIAILNVDEDDIKTGCTYTATIHLPNYEMFTNAVADSFVFDERKKYFLTFGPIKLGQIVKIFDWKDR